MLSDLLPDGLTTSNNTLAGVGEGGMGVSVGRGVAVGGTAVFVAVGEGGVAVEVSGSRQVRNPPTEPAGWQAGSFYSLRLSLNLMCWWSCIFTSQQLYTQLS